MDMSVDIAVIVTLNAKSALNMEHHQFEYDPPGEDVTTNNVIPMAWFNRNVLTTKNPKNGNTKNCNNIPVPIALRLCNCENKQPISTVPDIPNTSRNSKTEPVTSMNADRSII